MSDHNPPFEAENQLSNRTRLRGLIRTSLRKAGLHIVPDAVYEALTNLFVDEAVSARNRTAAMIDLFRERFAADEDNDRHLERLAYCVLACRVDGEAITMPEADVESLDGSEEVH